jgi:hypothetical protein
MKICPTCRRTYEDDGLNFCLEDGAVLTLAPGDAAPTVVMEQPRPTDPTPDTRMRTSWDAQGQPAYSMQPPKKSSKAWVWVLAIFAILILVCGGGVAGFFYYVATIANTNNNSAKGPSSARNTNTFTQGTPNASPGQTGEAQEIELSGWVEEPTVWLETSFADGEFLMTSRQKGYFYVLVAKRDEFGDAPVSRVTLRNTTDQPTELGYGLVFHSDITPLKNDYAFLIDTKKKKFRVVRHDAEQEKTVTAWTNSNLIKPGSEPNTLEARDKGDKIELYINNQLASTITNKQGPKGGVPGLYVGDGAKIGFSKFAVVK